ncbi:MULTISPECIES: ABC transporter ATP-binding protein [unclassified Roseitalea]|uniref:ABC transporter ATP-binding protein n=1 Tax=unclassified Roseitalea TaxID=2639107 RepID=UPI00273ED71D|nr:MULTISPECIES: ABC transporter ATP-binding protein [unclassified Roseitalea]
MAMADAMERPEATRTGGRPFFSCRNVESYYGESYIVQGVSFDIAENEIVALLGRNGAGKTSTLRTLARAQEPHLTAGEIWLDGQALHSMKAYQAARAGVQLVPEDRRIIPGITVEENLILAQTVEPRGWEIAQIYELFPRLGERKRQEANTLSGGEQQMLAIARALARQIKLLLLDEPYEGLAPTIVEEIEKTMEVIRRSGITTIIVEQNALAALRIADSAVILDMGEVVFRGTAQQVLDSEDLREQYLAV